MIDIAHETLIPILDVGGIVPVSVPTIRRWAAAGKIESVRAGRRLFTSREAIQRMLEQGPQPQQAPALTPTRKAKKRSTHLDRVRADLASIMGEAA